jgi:hypothetical protein
MKHDDDNTIADEIIAKWPFLDQLVVGMDLGGEVMVALDIDDRNAIILATPDPDDDESEISISLDRAQAQRLVEILQAWLKGEG